MLKELRIRNLAIIEDLTVRFGGGLNVLTGETGAGKSIIVDALGLALGDRAQPDLIKSGEKEASVEAYFDVGKIEGLGELAIDSSDGLFLRRVISSGGKSRAYINDTMVTLGTLSAVGRALVDIHSQHEHQSLLSHAMQRDLLDSFGRLEPDRRQVEALCRDVKALRDEYEGLKERVRERAHRLDLLRFQVGEIEAAALKPGEEEALENERKVLSHVSRLKELAEASYSLLYGSEGSCSETLSEVLGRLREMNSIDSGMEETLKTLESAMPLVEEASISLRNCRDRYDFEPGRLEEMEERIDLIKRLTKKYGESVEAVIEYREAAERETRALESSDERLEGIERELAVKEEDLLKAASLLSEKRQKTARKLEGLIAADLRELSFDRAALRIVLSREAGRDGRPKIDSSGMDKIEFLFSANPGEETKPLSKIISGGELSRVMLALKDILADVDGVPVLIFDEVDAGIGGVTAGSVGRKLDAISKRRQLLCITHLPQIASYGSFHLRIEKKSRGDGVCVEVKELSGTARKDEIARMLSGKVTEISLRHAGELLERVK